MVDRKRTRGIDGWAPALALAGTLLGAPAAQAGPPRLPPLPGQRVAEPAESKPREAPPEPSEPPSPATPAVAPRLQRPSTMTPPPKSDVAGPSYRSSAAPTPSPTSSPAPVNPRSRLATTTPVVASSRRIDRVDPVGLGRKNKPESADKPKLEHRGLVVDLATGVLGCTRAMCAGSTGHDSSPGVFASGFFGGNVGGIVEVGLLGGWGQLQAHAGNGANPLTMWGLSPDLLSEGLSVRSGDAGGGTSDLLQQMHTQDVALTTFHAAPALRIHFVPRGRVIAFAGAAAGYGGLAGAYGTDLGRLRLRAHGVVVPAEAGLGVHLTKNIALVARFDYLWMKYLLLGFEHSLQSGVVPVSMASKYSTVDLDDALPDFWAVTVGLRVRLF